MAKEVILLKLGEIALKGLNRRTFENVLLKNIRRRLTGAGEFAVTSVQSTIYVEPKNEEADMDLAEERCAKVFGVVGYTRAAVTEKELPKIREKAAEYLRDVLEEASRWNASAAIKNSPTSRRRFPRRWAAICWNNIPTCGWMCTIPTSLYGWRCGSRTPTCMWTRSPARGEFRWAPAGRLLC